jgi:hypothetical protein
LRERIEERERFYAELSNFDLLERGGHALWRSDLYSPFRA